MKKLNFTLFCICLSLLSFSQNHLNMTELAHLSFSEESSDIWGYVDDQGIEYAVIANFSEVKIYSLLNPSDPNLIQSVSVSGSSWHDIKSFGNYLYHVSESAADGITIIDMSDINNITSDLFEPSIDNDELRDIHNIYIDEFGFLYVSGSNIERGVLFFDLNNNPENPTLVGREENNYSHDIFVQNNIMYSSQVFAGKLEIFDVSNKSNPQKIGDIETTNSFTHNAWASDDGKYVFTTDERASAFVESYDISDLSDIQFLDKANSGSTDNSIIPHNTHYKDGYLITSWYTEGVIVMDATRPDILVKVGQYDTYQGSATGFDGCWGVYPFLPSGLIIASDISEGLFILQANYQHASYLEGTITDALTGLPINNATITINDTSISENSNAAGAYKSGMTLTGSQVITVSAPDYVSQAYKVNFTSGQTSFLDGSLYDTTISSQDDDGDGTNVLNDCDDNNPNIFPGNTEIIYNGIDDDCDPLTLDDDLDQDGYASANDCDDNNSAISPGVTEVPYNGIDEDCNPNTLDDDLDQDGYASANDCDDNNSGVYPGQTELAYNNLDDDCNPLTLDNDLDQDGFNNDQDCDDANADINPNAVEIPNNNIDEDCDGQALIIDNDNDGFNSDQDCDDANPDINPNATEIPNNNADENCDGQVLIIDNDNDGFNSDQDCDDTNADINPNAVEIPNNAIDEDCDGNALVIDNDNDGFNSDEDCDDDNPDINPSAPETPNNAVDEDCDGVALIIDNDNDGFNSDEDCDDDNPDINPSATEIPNNAVDEDCDTETLIIDNDNDGFNSDEDCDDDNDSIYPTAIEIANNGIDEDCDGLDLISSNIDLLDYKLDLFPNPFKDQVNVKISEPGDYQIQITSITGILLETKSINAEATIDLSKLKTGIYLAKIINVNTERKATQLIIKN